MLTITRNSVAIEKPQRATLAVNQPTLTFTPTVPGRPSFLILTVDPQHDDCPVTLTTDATDLFQLATDSSPRFSSTVTFKPSPTGSYVHVRYMADSRGTHTAQLLLTSASESRTVTLNGRSKGLLTAIPETHGKLKRGVLVATLLIGGLAVAGYNNRCQLFPDLCQNVDSNQAEARMSTIPSKPGIEKVGTVLSEKRDMLIGDTQKTSAGITELPFPKHKKPSVGSNLPAVTVSRQEASTTRQDVAHDAGLNKIPDFHDTTREVISERAVRKSDPAQTTQESDLERELNQTMPR